MELKEKERIIVNMINMMYESEIGKSIFIYSQVDEDYKFIGKDEQDLDDEDIVTNNIQKFIKNYMKFLVVKQEK